MNHSSSEIQAQSAHRDHGVATGQRSVAVKQIPAQLDSKRGRAFYLDLESSMNVERPSIVLDCSQAHDMDQQTVYVLLCCLEGAMKRNGDVRLAAVSPQARRNLELHGVDKLFRIYGTSEEAVESYRRRMASMPAIADQRAANAA